MPSKTQFHVACWLGLGAGLLLAACQSAPAPAVPVTRVTTPATPTVSVAATNVPASPVPSATRTLVADTPSARPSNTPTIAPTASLTNAPTDTPMPGTPAAAATATAPPTHSRVANAATPTGQPAPAPLYSTTSGPAGYSSSIKCERPGASCAPVMPPGDVSFRMVLASDSAAPWTHFINYGLSVEKDGANVANMFMFVDAGWLQPGGVVGFGASRNFAQPGTYVIRSSGCVTTDAKSAHCVWMTIAGDVVTFVIQP